MTDTIQKVVLQDTVQILATLQDQYTRQEKVTVLVSEKYQQELDVYLKRQTKIPKASILLQQGTPRALEEQPLNRIIMNIPLKKLVPGKPRSTHITPNQQMKVEEKQPSHTIKDMKLNLALLLDNVAAINLKLPISGITSTSLGLVL